MWSTVADVLHERPPTKSCFVKSDPKPGATLSCMPTLPLIWARLQGICQHTHGDRPFHPLCSGVRHTWPEGCNCLQRSSVKSTLCTMDCLAEFTSIRGVILSPSWSMTSWGPEEGQEVPQPDRFNRILLLGYIGSKAEAEVEQSDQLHQEW